MQGIDVHNLHHAYILEGKREALLADLDKFLQKEVGMQTHGNPNFLQREYTNFTVDDAREIQELHSRRPAAAGPRFFVLALNSITFQSQNALLKIFEEPGQDTHFFMIIPSLGRILPTLRSRAVVVSFDSVGKNDLATKFLASSKPERLSMIKDFLSDIEKEEKTKQDAIEFLQDILFLLYQKNDTANWKKKEKRALAELQQSINYASDQSSSIKLLLEHVALLI